MSDDPGSRETDDPDEEAGTERSGPLFSIYRRYVGEPQSSREVYLGFGLFFAGVGLGVAALVLFLISGTQPAGSDSFFQFREAALVFVLLALPAVAMSVSVLLPVGRWTTAASLGGSLVCVAATGWLVQVYPYSWTSAGNDVAVLSLYAVGVVVLAAATGSALVAQYLDRLAPATATTTTGGADDPDTDTQSTGDGEAISDEAVAADIEDAMADSTLTWGGVEQQPNTKRLNLEMPDTDTDTESIDAESATETRSASDNVDDAVDSLRRLQGGEQETARVQSPDDQVDALTQFRAQQTDDEEIETGVDAETGLLDRLRERIFR